VRFWARPPSRGTAASLFSRPGGLEITSPNRLSPKCPPPLKMCLKSLGAFDGGERPFPRLPVPRLEISTQCYLAASQLAMQPQTPHNTPKPSARFFF